MLFANIVVIKRNGTDGLSFPLEATACLFGRYSIFLPSVEIFQ